MNELRWFLLLTLMLSNAIFAQGIYKCISSDGKVSYQQQECPLDQAALIMEKPKAQKEHIKKTLLAVDISDDEKQDYKNIVINNMKDPTSVMLKDIRYYLQLPTREMVVCGKVNAKNSYGGYTGYSNFVIFEGRLAVVKDEKSLEDIYYNTMCNRPMHDDAN